MTWAKQCVARPSCTLFVSVIKRCFFHIRYHVTSRVPALREDFDNGVATKRTIVRFCGPPAGQDAQTVLSPRLEAFSHF